jgi:pimeloyl-ACP methyl ester carboxylesterase
MSADAKSHFINATDGLRLHAVEYGAANPGLPVVCLPGLARTAGDFATLAQGLAADTTSPRRVIVIEYRGRGLSGHDADPAKYNPAVEIGDLLTVLDALKVPRAAFVGTSRGGILTMLLAPLQPQRIAGAVLNDIGPVLQIEGLLRIKGYVGKLPHPKDHANGADILRGLFGGQFPNYTAADWLEAAKLTWRDENGRMVLTYDPKLSATLEGVAADVTPPSMWDQFGALRGVPLMLLRGALTDLISSATAAEMGARHPGMEFIEVADEGHPVRLGTPAILPRIAAFIRRCEIEEVA